MEEDGGCVLTVRVGLVEHVVEVEVEELEGEEEKGELRLDGETVSGNDVDRNSFTACGRSRDGEDNDEVELFEREREDVEGEVSEEESLLLLWSSSSSSRVAATEDFRALLLTGGTLEPQPEPEAHLSQQNA